MSPTSKNNKPEHPLHSNDPQHISSSSTANRASSNLPPSSFDLPSDLAGREDVPPTYIVLDPYMDRERLYVQYELLRGTFNEGFDRALQLGELSTDPADASWSVLDVGCGEGLFAGEISTRYPRASVIGFDKDREAIGTANTVFGRHRNGEGRTCFYTHDALDPIPSEFKKSLRVTPAVNGEVEEVGEGDIDFDVAFAHLVLMHLREPVRVIANIKAALKPGGVVYLCDMPLHMTPFPNPSYNALMKVASDAMKLIATPDCALRHRKYLEDVGFEHIESRTVSYMVGGNTKEGQRMFNNLVSGLKAARSGLVDALHLINGEEFDEHMHHIMSETTPEMMSEIEVVNTIARKPARK